MVRRDDEFCENRPPPDECPVCPRSSFSEPLAKLSSQNTARARFCDVTELADPAIGIEQFDCPMCEAPAGSACRTRGGKVAPKYHTPRFMLVPQLCTELEVRTPAERGPGRV